MNQASQSAARPHDPFDDSAPERQKRMGLLTEAGLPNAETMEMFCSLYAGLFYDDICDHCGDFDTAISICHSLIALAEKDDSRRVLLTLSLQYDAMQRSLPDPIWWIAGNPTLVSAFIEGFSRRLSALINAESEVI